MKCTGLISTNPCHKINHQLRYPKCIVLGVGAKKRLVKKLLIRWCIRSITGPGPDCAGFDGR